MEPLLSFTEVRVERHHHQVLLGCTAEVRRGVTVLMGPNGSGKSTLLHALTGQVRSSGSITWSGAPLGRRGLDREQGRLVGYLPQEPSFPADVTVGRALAYACWLRPPPPGSPGPSDLLDLLGILDVRDERVGDLSVGTRRLALLAVAVAHRPRVLVLDEPTAGVDGAHRRRLRRFLRDGPQVAVLMASHLVDDVDLVADHVLVLAHGRLAFDGPPDELHRIGEAARSEDESTIEAALRCVGATAA